MNDEMEWLKIITAVGNARSKYIEAIQEAKAGNYEACNALVREGNESYAAGHRIHAELISKEAGGEKNEFSLLFMHAEDQLMSAETFKILLHEFLDICRRFDELERRICS